MILYENKLGNHLLSLLPKHELHYLRPAFKLLYLEHGTEIYKQDGFIHDVYFPLTAVLGLVVHTEDGRLIEGASVGNEGMVGLPIFLGSELQPSQVITQIPGEVIKINAKSFMQAAQPGSAVDLLFRRYTLYRLRSAKQTGVCNTMHSAEERMCHWLLAMQDRTERDDLMVTHEFLSESLGLRRQTVSITAATLQQAGLITYRRGLMRIENREGLEAASCECYQYMKDLFCRVTGVDTKGIACRNARNVMSRVARPSSKVLVKVSV